MSEDKPEELGSSEVISNSQPREPEQDEGSLLDDKSQANISGEDKKSHDSGQENSEDGQRCHQDPLELQK